MSIRGSWLYNINASPASNGIFFRQMRYFVLSALDCLLENRGYWKVQNVFLKKKYCLKKITNILSYPSLFVVAEKALHTHAEIHIFPKKKFV